MSPIHRDLLSVALAHKQPSPQPRRHMLRLILNTLFLSLLLFTSVLSGWGFSRSYAYAATRGNPNPHLSPPSWLKPQQQHVSEPYHLAKLDPHYQYVASPRSQQVSMSPATLTLSPQAQQFVSNDGRLEVDIPAGALSAAQVQSAGGSITLKLTQILPGSGGARSEHLFFGTYQLQLLDASGAPAAHLALAQPLVLRYHLLPSQETLLVRGQAVYAILRGGDASTLLAGVAPTTAAKNQPSTASRLLLATADKTGLVWSVSSNLTVTTKSTFALTPNTITFGTQAPQATWGNPQDFQVDLNSGGLTYTYPLDFPPGPGGFTPTMPLTYASGSVDENHNLQSAAPWVGQGWNLSLGSISWSQENVTPGGTNKLENVWHINDPTGISGQLIPPDLNASTAVTLVPSPLPSPYVWHTAPESHAKVNEILSGSLPCWRVFLPNGVIENFGCGSGSRQTYIDSGGHTVVWRWDLDLLTDRFGNQIQITYQNHTNSDGSIRDAVPATIEYDDPTCHDTNTRCTGSNWNPKVKIIFDASRIVANLTNTDCNGWPGNNFYRCDDPVDLEGSGGLPVPKVLNSEALNDIKVQVQGSTLREYKFFYAQSHPQTITDPLSGQSESIAGYFNLSEVEQDGTNGTALNAPEINMQYTNLHQHYSDLFRYATPTTNCSPASWSPRDGNGACYLWSRSYNAYYLSNLDNGRGWNESITYQEGRNNTHGVDSGAIDNPFTCDGNESTTNKCGEADDKNWSHYAVSQRTATSNGETSTWGYKYWLQTGLGSNFVAVPCADCHQGFTWGNQNDNDYADFYNGQFESFVKAEVDQPDGSYQAHIFGATTGWGEASSSITCAIASCQVAPYFANAGSILAPTYAGKEQQEHDYDTNGNLLLVHVWGYANHCPPQGVPNSGNNGGDATKNPGQTQLISELDQNNPVVVCDTRVVEEQTYQVDGVTTLSGYATNPNVVYKDVVYEHDKDNQGVSGYDYGNLDNTDATGNDVGGNHFVTHTTFYPHDDLTGQVVYLTDLPAITQTRDGSGTPVSCSQAIYGSNSTATAAPNVPAVTKAQAHITAGTSGCGSTTNLITVQHTYDPSGNPVTGTDGDNHQGCSLGGSTYSACAVYDALNTHVTSATNAKNQVTTYGYDTSAAGGFGQWLTSTVDVNGQTTTYQYDILGRLTGIVRPGDSAGSPTVTYTYTNTCTVGTTSPCLELDTSTRFTVGGPVSTMKQWYDGWGHLVETQSPSPSGGQTIVTYTIYQNDSTNGNRAIKSLPYAIATPAGYVNPDQTQPRSITRVDGLNRSLGSVTYSDATTIVLSTSVSYTAAQGVQGIASEGSTPYEQTIMFDAYNHQAISYADALGRTRYTQFFSGTASPYTVLRTVGYTYDTLGNTIQVQTYDSTAMVKATYSATFDALKRRTGFNDSDLGSCSNTPLPAGCSSSSDTAWKSTFDGDNNQLSQSDTRNQSVYASYDLLDRPLCRGTSSAAVNPCQSSAYATYFYDSYNNASNPTLTFPSGCTAPSGSYASDPIGHTTAEFFSGNGSVGTGWRCSGFDQRGQTDQSTLSVTADGQTTTQTVNLLYNDGGEVTGLVYPDGETVTSQYDVNGRFQSSYFGAANAPDPVNFLAGQTSYTAWGALASMSIGGSGPKASGPTTPIFTTAFGYDSIERPLSRSATRNSVAFWSQALTYDNVGNILGATTTVPTASSGTLTQSEAFCYDALSRLVWAGNTGTPTGGDHCMTAPTGTTLPTYQQAYSYDSLDRLTSGDKGTVSYGDSNHVHAATTLGSLPNAYASYDAMGDMTCRNIDTSTAHTCASGSANGATMTYDAEGRMDSWTTPSGTTASDKFLYDNEGNRVLQRTSTTAGGTTTVTDDITFDGFTEVTISGGTTATSKYYSTGGQRVAMRVNGLLSYLLSDNLGSSTVALNSDGSGQAVQLFSPFGSVRYSWGTMPTTYNFTGQRLDSQTGLLYYNSRYYDPVSERFMRADMVESNAGGMDPFAYVGDNPETKSDPTGHTGGDPYIQYIYAWYMTFHPGDNVNAPVFGRQWSIPNSKVPKGSPSKWPSPSVGNTGDGVPDIANQTLHVIWEVKSGGEKGFYATGSRFASKRTGYYADATAQWYADRATIVTGTPWSPGDPSILGNDPAVGVYFNAFCGGITGTCYFEVPGGPTLAIQLVLTARGKPVTGVFTYRVIPPTEAWRPIPVFALSPEASLSLWELLNAGKDSQPQPRPAPAPAFEQPLFPFGPGSTSSNLSRLLFLNG